MTKRFFPKLIGGPANGETAPYTEQESLSYACLLPAEQRVRYVKGKFGPGLVAVQFWYWDQLSHETAAELLWLALLEEAGLGV